ncbi:MAG: glycoside hydrolase family 25 protein [Chloroflexi bacterium]|nr:glycoside hydrolase family 25 protein [Chloroflexota bacterium]
MKYPVIGVDTSRWEGRMDTDKTFAAGASFIFPKAGQGEYTDPEFVNTWGNARKSGLKRGAFWYLDIGYSIKGQAQKFTELLKNDPGEIEPYVDFEQAAIPGKDPVTGRRGLIVLSETELSGFITYFKQAIANYFDKWPWPDEIGIYTGYSYWREHGSGSSFWKKFPLWISEPDPVEQPSALAPWTTWKYWQTSFAADGIKFGTDPLQAKGIDMDCFNGTLEQFQDMYGVFNVPPIIIPPVEPPIGGNMSYSGNIKSTVLPYANIRDKADGQDIGDVAPGTAITGDQIVGGLNGYSWMHVTTVEAKPQTGWVRVDLLDFRETAPTPPTGPGDVILKHTIETYSDGSVKIDGNVIA